MNFDIPDISSSLSSSVDSPRESEISCSTESVKHVKFSNKEFTQSTEFIATLNKLRLNTPHQPPNIDLVEAHVHAARESAAQERIASQSEILKLKFELELSKHSINRLNVELESTRAQLSDKEQQISDMKRMAQDSKDGAQSNVKNDLSSKQQEIDELTAEVRALRSLRDAHANCDIVVDTIREREREIIFLRRKCKGLEMENHHVTAKLEQSNVIKSEIEDDLRTLLTQRGHISSMKNDILALEKTRSASVLQLEYSGN